MHPKAYKIIWILNVCLFLLSLQRLQSFVPFWNSSLNKCCKTHLGHMLPPAGRGLHLIYPMVWFCWVWHFCLVMKSVIVLSIIVLSIIVLSIIVLSIIVLSIIVLSIIVLSIIVLSIIVPSIIVLSIIVTMLNVVMLSAIRLIVWAPLHAIACLREIQTADVFQGLDSNPWPHDYEVCVLPLCIIC